MALWARQERGDQVGAAATRYVRNAVASNLHNAGSNQSDASFGFTAGIAEALIQSHADEISLLPALPAVGGMDRSRGCGLRGGFEVDMEWKDDKLRCGADSQPKCEGVQGALRREDGPSLSSFTHIHLNRLEPAAP